MPKRIAANNNAKQQKNFPCSFSSVQLVVPVLIVICLLECYQTFLSYRSQPSLSHVVVVENKINAAIPTRADVHVNDAEKANEEASSSPQEPISATVPPQQKTATTTTIPITLEEIIARNDPNRTIVFVHVGKAGGSTFRQKTASFCLQTHKDNQERREECMARFQTNPNLKLAQQTTVAIHMFDRKPELVSNATSFLMSLRNPIDRAHSTYRYSHPANCHHGELVQLETGKLIRADNFGCTIIDTGELKNGTVGEAFYKHCFPSPAMEELARSLLPPYPPIYRVKPNCRTMAREMVRGDGHGRFYLAHLHYNYKYYSELTVGKHPDREFFALRTEHELEDIVRLDRALGGTGEEYWGDLDRVTHGSEVYEPSVLSKQSMQKLCCVLEDEVRIYLELFDLALNLDASDKKEAEIKLRSQCGLEDSQTWEDWRTNCQAELKAAEHSQ